MTEHDWTEVWNEFNIISEGLIVWPLLRQSSRWSPVSRGAFLCKDCSIALLNFVSLHLEKSASWALNCSPSSPKAIKGVLRVLLNEWISAHALSLANWGFFPLVVDLRFKALIFSVQSIACHSSRKSAFPLSRWGKEKLFNTSVLYEISL